MTFTVEMVGVEDVLLREIPDHQFKQADIALTYAFGIVSSEDVDWPKVNAAIIERWSPTGLTRVKEMAWKRIDDRNKAAQ